MSLVPTLPTIPEPAILTCIASVNEARAMRIAEILSDFRHLQHFIANIRANPSAEEYYEEGYCVLRQCAGEAQALLNQPFDCQGPEPDGNDEEEKAQLQRVMMDASIRRFKIQQTYLKASAALRWVNSRTVILGGSQPQSVHAPALQQITNTMRSELASVTPARVELSLRSQDSIHGKWLVEDPTWSAMEQIIRTGR
ncbi:hypothetical protein AUEXF2481DRAFT_7413 [Aureobasidium subglaciale EXF-2481]|uniref:Uncharacterized protein n=1 Tax=Aureobasidium subglaciale (strain EXF-2481) TaxID=1043005 RepID=A0A074Y4H9_AURSE|nr:uncharacterized protein AUEXF2481DRAFT_7413 [Aureobasidium subglaciale EXF-2481]KEQ92673.1 hypothetical protein AUEXF2481DRAFT_7413 [Aureobasidium subglaciale EXF-2481]